MHKSVEDAYERAFNEYSDALFRYAYFRIASRERARDLTQDAFIKTWDHLREGGTIQHWKNFLYKVLNNLIIDEYRKGKTQSLEALAEKDPVRADALMAHDSRSEKEERLDEELMIKKIHTYLPQLPESYRVSVTLRYVEGLSPKEIALLLDISENAASVRINRGLNRLRKLCGHLITL